MSAQILSACAMHPANTLTRAEALARYTSNVRTWLELKQHPVALAPAEIEIVHRAWNVGLRTDQTADEIATDRELVGIGFGRNA
jgi:hypothetical protein